MSSLFIKIFSITSIISMLFFYITISLMTPSANYEQHILRTAKLKHSSGLSIASSPYYGSDNFYIGTYKDNFMSFAYAH